MFWQMSEPLLTTSEAWAQPPWRRQAQHPFPPTCSSPNSGVAPAMLSTVSTIFWLILTIPTCYQGLAFCADLNKSCIII